MLKLSQNLVPYFGIWNILYYERLWKVKYFVILSFDIFQKLIHHSKEYEKRKIIIKLKLIEMDKINYVSEALLFPHNIMDGFSFTPTIFSFQ